MKEYNARASYEGALSGKRCWPMQFTIRLGKLTWCDILFKTLVC